MNPPSNTLYFKYLNHTGNKPPPVHCFDAAPMTTELLGFNEAARYLNLSPSALRKLMDHSRQRLCGLPVKGPTLRFFQSQPGAALKFRRAWLDAYIEAGTHRPDEAPILTPTGLPTHTPANHIRRTDSIFLNLDP
jgi:hypothetical protein